MTAMTRLSRDLARTRTVSTRVPTGQPRPDRTRVRVALVALVLVVAIACAAGCGTSHPKPLAAATLAEEQTFPYYPVYWAGPSFEGQALDAVDGRKTYITSVGESVYYGDCASGKGIFGSGTCELPLQVTTSIWRVHKNTALGSQHNLIVRGVPATAYDEGRSLELYSGQVAIDVFSDTPARALSAAKLLQPVNAPGAPLVPLPPPVYCPELVGHVDNELEGVMNQLPGRVCQRSRTAEQLTKKLA
jgi:hypothetical protein